MVNGPAFTIEDGKISPPPCKMPECRLCTCRTEARQPIRGRGNTAAQVLIVGTTPGADEDKANQVFIGDSGNELKRWLPLFGLDEPEVYITNAVKCHTSENRKPKASELSICRDTWLLREVCLLPNLKVVLTLGRQAKEALLGTKKEVAGMPLSEATRCDIQDPLGRTLAVFPLNHPTYFMRAREEKPYFLRVVVPELRAALVQLGVARAD